jgi:hypothetical protein
MGIGWHLGKYQSCNNLFL